MWKQIICVFVFLFSLHTTVEAQTRNNSKLRPKSLIEVASCNENVSHLSILNQYTDNEDLIIVIAHANISEKNQINGRRMHNAITFLTKGFEKGFNRSIDSIVAAEGQKTSGFGYLDFYVKGELELRILLNKNQDLILSPCVLQFPDKKCSSDIEKSYFPCRGQLN